MAYSDTPTGQVANNPWDGYKAVPSSFADAGDTGLTTGHAYICFDVADLDSLTEAQSVAATGSVKQIIFALAKAFYDWYAALAAADVPDKLTVQQHSAGGGSGLTDVLRHVIQTTHAVGTTVAAE